jgi:thiaminase/transcriptional activator TenA
MSFSQSLKEKTKSVWEDCYYHPFVQKIGNGTLDKDVFMFYLKQDYKYLIEYAKVFALGAMKASEEKLIVNFTSSQKAVLDEMDIHRSYMTAYGISNEEAENSSASLFNIAYISNMMVVGLNNGVLELMAALLPCAWSYYDFACRLRKDFKDNFESNYYKSWIETYSSKEFHESFSWFFPAMDKLLDDKNEKERLRIVDIFRSSMEFEYLFWDMSYKRQLSYK